MTTEKEDGRIFTIPDNDTTNLWRIVFTFCIVALHEGNTPSYGWKMAVEFFFICSGMLLAMEKEYKRTPIKKYIIKRVYRLYPHYIFSYCIYMYCWMWVEGYSLSEITVEFKYSLLEIFMLQALGVGRWCSNHGAVWYVSVLFMVSVVAYTLLVKLDKRSILCVCFLGIILGIVSKCFFGNWCIATFQIANRLTLIPGLIRGISEISLGIICFYLGEKISENKIIKEYYWIWNAVELFLMSGVIIYLYFHLKNEILVTTLIAISTMLAFWCEHPWITGANRALKCGGKITYAIYLNHPLFILLLGDNGSVKWGILFLIVTLYSVGTYVVIRKISVYGCKICMRK